MKKIFAIALAVVMVLSMASAFALNACSGNFTWSCPADVDYCGKGSIEVIPYVKANNSCGGYDWQVSTCASAVNTENVFYAVKVTVEANADPDWWKAAKATLTYDGLVAKAPKLAAVKSLDAAVPADDKDEAQEFYYDFVAGAWVIVDDNFKFGDAYVRVEEVKKAADAEVCAKLVSENSGVGTWTYGDYTVKVSTSQIVFSKGTDKVTVLVDAVSGKINSVTTTDDDFFAEVVSVFNLGGCAVGTCINADNIQANFGWDDEVKSCFSWSDKAVSIVDAECVVAIPKTGDASVLAWLF